MLMPGRHGYSSQGGWATGEGENGLPGSLTVRERSDNEPAEYKATEQIDFIDGFESELGDVFEALITDGGSSGSGANGLDGSEGGYRYGFNGKEQDPEVKGAGTQYDYGFRIYDPRIGRFLSVDPLSAKYSMLTPYQFASNRPIDGIDLDGLEYLNATMSKIDIAVSHIEFNGEVVISGSVYLDRSKLDRATIGFIDYGTAPKGTIGSPRATIAVFKSNDYNKILEKVTNALKPKEAEATDMSAESLKQPEIETARIPKNKKEEREIRKSGKFTVPGGVAGGSAKGDLIVALVELTGKIGEGILGARSGNDFDEAKSQLPAVTSVINDIQFGLNNKVFNAQDLPNLGKFANYILDGKLPTTSQTSIDKNGNSTYQEFTDTNMVKRFDEIRTKISQKRNEANEPNQCVPCLKNN